MDKNIPKAEYKDMLNVIDEINNKISAINETGRILAKIKVELNEQIKLIYESVCELQGEIYRDDSWLKKVELNKIDAMIDGVLNVTWNMNRKKVE